MILNKVKLLAAKRGWSVAELERESGLSYATCYRMTEGSTARVDFTTLDALCRTFGVGVGDLLEYSAGPVPLEVAAAL